jgi:hypothetical protein
MLSRPAHSRAIAPSSTRVEVSARSAALWPVVVQRDQLQPQTLDRWALAARRGGASVFCPGSVQSAVW